MEEEENLRIPFWQTTDAYRGPDDRRRTSSLILNSSVALVFLLIVVFCVIFVVIPSFLSSVSQIFRPHLVKKGWDSLNLVLVLFAILCGFLSRNYDRSPKSNSSTPRQWQGNSDRTSFKSTLSGLRSSSSYSDLLHQTSWPPAAGDERWRFADDTYVTNYQFSRSDRQVLEEGDFDLGEKRTPSRNTFVVDRENVSDFTPRSSSPQPFLPPSPPSNPAPPPPYTISAPKVVKRKVKRSYDASGTEGKTENREETVSEVKNLQPAEIAERKSERNDRKRGGATKEILTTLKRKKKTQRQKSVENIDTIFSSEPPSLTPSSPPPAPALQSPSSSVFQSIFSSKKGKSKKSHSASKASKSETLSQPLNSHKHQLPSDKINDVEEHVNSGSESPLSQIPKPPPLPPFNMPEWKFQVQGDFVRIKSSKSSPGTTPEGSPTNASLNAATNDGTKTPIFCSSPDVNSKADNFIAKFRAGLELEKMKSFKQKQGRRSNLGRDR